MPDSLPTLLKQRQACVDKIAVLKLRSADPANDPMVSYLLGQLRSIDVELLKHEVHRLKTQEHYKFDGNTLAEQLGADAWLLPNKENK